MHLACTTSELQTSCNAATRSVAAPRNAQGIILLVECRTLEGEPERSAHAGHAWSSCHTHTVHTFMYDTHVHIHTPHTHTHPHTHLTHTHTHTHTSHTHPHTRTHTHAPTHTPHPHTHTHTHSMASLMQLGSCSYGRASTPQPGPPTRPSSQGCAI